MLVTSFRGMKEQNSKEQQRTARHKHRHTTRGTSYPHPHKQTTHATRQCQHMGRTVAIRPTQTATRRHQVRTSGAIAGLLACRLWLGGEGWCQTGQRRRHHRDKRKTLPLLPCPQRSACPANELARRGSWAIACLEKKKKKTSGSRRHITNKHSTTEAAAQQQHCKAKQLHGRTCSEWGDVTNNTLVCRVLEADRQQARGENTRLARAYVRTLHAPRLGARRPWRQHQLGRAGTQCTLQRPHPQ